MANTQLAYPFTKSNRSRDKIMSEVMITGIIKSLSPVPKFIISKSGNNPDEVIFDGYYFKLDGDALTAKDLYFCTSPEGANLGESFPELWRDAEGECLFTSQQALPSGYIVHEVHIRDAVGGNIILPTYEQAFKPWFVADVDDVATRQANITKIWIKADTQNPHVYLVPEDDTSPYDDRKWTPLGAVYKSTTTT